LIFEILKGESQYTSVILVQWVYGMVMVMECFLLKSSTGI